MTERTASAACGEGVTDDDGWNLEKKEQPMEAQVKHLPCSLERQKQVILSLMHRSQPCLTWTASG